jgi:hypothetical protein
MVSSMPPRYYCNKVKGNLIHATSCFLGLNQHNNSVSNSALLDLVLTNINDLRVSVLNYPMVASDNCHPPLNGPTAHIGPWPPH